MTAEGLTYRADPKHAEPIWEKLGLTRRPRGATTAFVREDVEGDDVLLDHIPLHEILSVTRGDADLPILFDVLDADGDGLVTAWDLLDGLALWGFSPDDVASIFYQDLNNTYFGDRSVLECRYRRRRRRQLRQRQSEREDYYGVWRSIEVYRGLSRSRRGLSRSIEVSARSIEVSRGKTLIP